jgi:hypothetical protein
MFVDHLSRRILALPADVRALLAGVEGPGWRVYQDHKGRLGVYTEDRSTATCYHQQHAWFPANPAAAVAAVTRNPLWYAYKVISYAMPDGDKPGDDALAAIRIIEAAIAARNSA